MQLTSNHIGSIDNIPYKETIGASIDIWTKASQVSVLTNREDVSGMKQKRYNQEFKQTIVELYRSGTAVSDLSHEYGVSEVTIYKWSRSHSPIKNGAGRSRIHVQRLCYSSVYA